MYDTDRAAQQPRKAADPVIIVAINHVVLGALGEIR
jgi:hypothetical protein